MNYSTIKNPPKNDSEYIKVPTGDQSERFVRRLLALLHEGKPHIMTDGPVPIRCATEAIEFSKSNGYQVTMMRCDDPADPGGIMSTLGTFYFHRQPDSK